MSDGLFYRCPCYISGTGNIAVGFLSIRDVQTVPQGQGLKCEIGAM